jgi:transposase
MAQVASTTKRQTNWIGYKVHLTETCDEQLPLLITEVKTTLAPSLLNTGTHPAFNPLLIYAPLN